jgi:hypothetical protein
MRIRWNLPLVAAILLTGIGLYYFLFETAKANIWLYLLIGALLNFIISFRMKGWNER